MKLILFIKTITNPACRQLIEALDQMAVPFQIVRDRHALQNVMLNTRTNEALFIFVLLDGEDMKILDEMLSHIQDRKIITILPDDTEHFRSIGCSVLPRFQAVLSEDMSMVAEVAARIISTDRDGVQCPK